MWGHLRMFNADINKIFLSIYNPAKFLPGLSKMRKHHVAQTAANARKISPFNMVTHRLFECNVFWVVFWAFKEINSLNCVFKYLGNCFKVLKQDYFFGGIVYLCMIYNLLLCLTRTYDFYYFSIFPFSSRCF